MLFLKREAYIYMHLIYIYILYIYIFIYIYIYLPSDHRKGVQIFGLWVQEAASVEFILHYLPGRELLRQKGRTVFS